MKRSESPDKTLCRYARRRWNKSCFFFSWRDTPKQWKMDVAVRYQGTQNCMSSSIAIIYAELFARKTWQHLILVARVFGKYFRWVGEYFKPNVHWFGVNFGSVCSKICNFYATRLSRVTVQISSFVLFSNLPFGWRTLPQIFCLWQTRSLLKTLVLSCCSL